MCGPWRDEHYSLLPLCMFDLTQLMQRSQHYILYVCIHPFISSGSFSQCRCVLTCLRALRTSLVFKILPAQPTAPVLSPKPTLPSCGVISLLTSPGWRVLASCHQLWSSAGLTSNTDEWRAVLAVCCIFLLFLSAVCILPLLRKTCTHM